MNLVLLQWLTAASTFVCLSTVLILRRMDPEEPSLNDWLMSVGLFVATMIVSSAREIVPGPSTIIVSNVLGALGFAYLVRGLRVLLRLEPGRRLFVPLALIAGVTTTWFTLVTPDVVPRMVIISLTMAALFFYCSLLLFRHHETGLTGMVRFAGVVTALIGLGHLARAIAAPFANIPEDYISDMNLVTSSTYISTVLVWAIVAVLLSVAVATRVQLRLQDAIHDADEANLRLLEMSWLDSATQTTNRSRIAGILSGAVDSSSLFGVPLAAVLVAIEGPRRLGLDPRLADVCMSQVADALRTGLNLVEPDFETIGRWGDDAFLVVLSGASRNDALSSAHRMASLLDRCENRSGWESYRIGVTTHIVGDTVEVLLDRLYAATFDSRTEIDSVRCI